MEAIVHPTIRSGEVAHRTATFCRCDKYDKDRTTTVSDIRTGCPDARRGTAATDYARRFAMLVLSRRELERIQVGDATITILSASRGRVRVGINAPREIKVVRSELKERDSEQEAA